MHSIRIYHAFTVYQAVLSISHSHLLSSFQQPYEAKTHYYPHFTDEKTEAQKFAQGDAI